MASIYMGGRLIVKDSNIFALPGTDDKVWHQMTISKGNRLFMCFSIENREGVKYYIEEVTTGQFEIIKEQEEWEEIASFAKERGFSTTKV